MMVLAGMERIDFIVTGGDSSNGGALCPAPLEPRIRYRRYRHADELTDGVNDDSPRGWIFVIESPTEKK
jgi:hypothetical protein